MTASAIDPCVQAWIELNTRDPEAVSALATARAHLDAGHSLRDLRRLRCIELRGPLPARAAVLEMLHRSTQFYNPYKERCTLRSSAAEAAPVSPGAQVVLVTERGAERRAAAERWWMHESGEKIEVFEGVAWVLAFESGTPAAEWAAELAVLRDRRRGLLCNPHSQDHRLSGADVPLPWIAPALPERAGTR